MRLALYEKRRDGIVLWSFGVSIVDIDYSELVE